MENPMPTAIATEQVREILSQYRMFRNPELLNHIVELHDREEITVLAANMLSDRWDGSLKIDIGNLRNAYSVVEVLISPMMFMAPKFSEIRMVDSNTIEFWWD